MTRYSNSVIAVVSFAILFCSILSLVLTSVNGALAAGGNTTTAENSAVNSGSSASTKLNKIKVIASFYPIFEFVKKVGGDRVEVSSLIPVGIEPHEYEPTIQQV